MLFISSAMLLTGTVAYFTLVTVVLWAMFHKPAPAVHSDEMWIRYTRLRALPRWEAVVSSSAPAPPRRRHEANQARAAIDMWSPTHLGAVLPVTRTKDYAMIEPWDDRCVQGRANTGKPVGESTRGPRANTPGIGSSNRRGERRRLEDR
jgi:hypothetical protein